MDSYKIYKNGNYSYRVYPNGDVYTEPHSVQFSDGHIQTYKSKKKKIFIQTLKDGSKGYPEVSLQYDKRKAQAVGLHRILAEMFIPNPDNLPCVNHKDGNKMNYDLNNLEWVTYRDNIIHAYKNNLNYSKTKKVYCPDLDMMFSSVKAAANYVNGNRCAISNVCCGRAKTYKKMQWKYVD